MAASKSLRLFTSLRPSVCTSCWNTPAPQSLLPVRQLSVSTPTLAKDFMDPSASLKPIESNFMRGDSKFRNMIPAKDDDPFNAPNLTRGEWEEDDRHHLHIYAHKHNTHLTLTKPDRNALISVSCGNIGFRKAGRGTYDAAYQLAAFVMSRIQDKGLLPQIKKLELVFRGFGPGREAVTKAILGSEGKKIRGLVVRLSDQTRLKFGGTRSKKPRRLG
ncbi:translational machinery component [Amniculicola lignicola CBS 123094]|uniref:Small ribosomal subunit protein uS11m n=1 Tax=Amniculicola lignicola CBS 123094 TaxID=1392246 RepID=A0A6A5WP35_9PLEO|nr:translational machinery component [Amniculicola lignicola CBS 123094]